jgi:hypothetical protein
VRLNYTFVDHYLSSARQLSGNSSQKTYFFCNFFHDDSQMFFEVEFVVNLQPKYLILFTSSSCSLSIDRDSWAPTSIRLLERTIYFVLFTFNFSLLNFNHFGRLARSSFIFSMQSCKLSPETDRSVSSAKRLIVEWCIAVTMSLIYNTTPTSHCRRAGLGGSRSCEW